MYDFIINKAVRLSVNIEWLHGSDHASLLIGGCLAGSFMTSTYSLPLPQPLSGYNGNERTENEMREKREGNEKKWGD